MTQPVIHLVDDDASFRTAIGRVLEIAGYRVALYESGKQYLENLPSNEPGCILLDLNMSPMTGLELQEQLSRIGRYSPIIFLTGHGDIPVTVQAIKGGADNFLTKPVSKDTLIAAIEAALGRFAEARARQGRLDNLRELVSKLTTREQEVFALVVRGKLNKQIAHVLGKSERTIKVDRHSVMEKLKVRSLAEAVSIAERLGMLPLHDEHTSADC
jgi:FixJ family two-component response regulator